MLTAASAFEEHSSGEGGEPGSLGFTVPMTGHREFLVQGRISEGTQTLELRLRIMQANGACAWPSFCSCRSDLASVGVLLLALVAQASHMLVIPRMLNHPGIKVS